VPTGPSAVPPTHPESPAAALCRLSMVLEEEERKEESTDHSQSANKTDGVELTRFAGHPFTLRHPL